MHQVVQLRALGHEVDVLQIRGDRSRLRYLAAAREVFVRTRRGSYDVVHAHYGLSGVPALFRSRGALVVTLHGSDTLLGRVQPFISRCVCSLADAVIAVSPTIAAKIPGHVIPCGVDLSVFRPLNRLEARARLGLPVDKRLILFPFDPRRKVKRYDRAQAVVQRLRDLNAQLVTVTGVPNEDMPWYYSAADAMLLCSESEGSPTSVKEALACDLPVVATAVGDVAQILAHLPRTRVCAADITELAQAMRQVLNDDRDGEPHCRRDAMRRYDQRAITQAIVDVYRSVLPAGDEWQSDTHDR